MHDSQYFFGLTMPVNWREVGNARVHRSGWNVCRGNAVPVQTHTFREGRSSSRNTAEEGCIVISFSVPDVAFTLQ